MPRGLPRGLFTLLLGEVLKDVPVESDIIVVPDGILGKLPFEALLMEDGEYVEVRWKLTYAFSATVLAFNRRMRGSVAERPLFALGNPVFNEDDPRYLDYKKGKLPPELPSDQVSPEVLEKAETKSVHRVRTTRGGEDGFGPLQSTYDEVLAIAKKMEVEAKPPDVLLGVRANETTFKRAPLKTYRYLHFATHGDTSREVEGINEPFLLLGRMENEGDDGYLTMTEVMELSLDAEMVVLSACLTGMGKEVEGEGVMNLARAFHHARARSVVVSLWKVTAGPEGVEFMNLFYKYLKSGKGKGEALRLARQEIKSKYHYPYFWAPFVLYGEL